MAHSEAMKMKKKEKKKIYIIKYKANKLCCYIDEHIW